MTENAPVLPKNVYHVMDGQCRYVQGTPYANPAVNGGDYSIIATCSDEAFLEFLFMGEECNGSNYFRQWEAVYGECTPLTPQGAVIMRYEPKEEEDCKCDDCECEEDSDDSSDEEDEEVDAFLTALKAI